MLGLDALDLLAKVVPPPVDQVERTHLVLAISFSVSMLIVLLLHPVQHLRSEVEKTGPVPRHCLGLGS